MASNGILQRFENIIKPKEDKRNYLGLQLANKLKVLLVSDPETDISAAALSVHVGSMSDPWEVQGIAHFLEHMLFMGTKKYPNENEYSKFLSQHGGSSNAYTSETITNYYFDVAPDYLVPSLDRFSQFFISPLMLEGSVNREIEAVHSEYSKNVKNDSWRLLQIKKLFACPKHDFAKFSIGNCETLRDSPYLKNVKIRDELLKFYDKKYSANIMSLCIYGKETLEELTQITTSMFSEIVNKNLEPSKWEIHPYSSEQLMKIANVVPIKDKRSMDFVFVYPDETEHYKSSPGMYLSHLIGHEGKGSLLSELKEHGLCSSLASYVDCSDGFGFFHINVDLTEKALNELDEVIIIVFQYINLMKIEGPKKYVFDENKGINYIKFNFMEKYNPIDYVQKLSAEMNRYPLNDILSANFLIDNYNPELIQKMLEYLKIENCNIVVVSKSFEGKTKEKEKYFGTEHNVMNIPKSLIEKLKNLASNENLKFPEPNEFIPTNFDILKANDKDQSSNVPVILEETDFLKVWYLKDQIYLKPKVFYAFKLINPIAYSNPFNVNLISLFPILFKDALTEFLYSAKLAGLSFDMISTVYGLEIELWGFNQKMDIFLKKILQMLLTFVICPKRFEILKEKYTRNLKSYPTQPLYHLASYYLKLTTTDNFWSYDYLIEALDRVTVDSVNNFIKSFFINFSIEAFFHGNCDRKVVLDITKFFRNELVNHYSSIPLRKHSTHPREIVLNSGSYTYEVINDIQKPKVINIYFQICFDNLNDICKLLLVEQLLDEPFFDILRTKEQLGYVVFAKTREFNGVYGFKFCIMSEYNVNYLEDRIEAFILWAEKHISEMNNNEFLSEKRSLITKLLKKKKRLFDFSRQLWSEIIKEEYKFNRNKKLAENVENFSKNDVLEYFMKHFSLKSDQRKKIAIKIVKSSEELNQMLPQEKGELKAPPRQESQIIKCVEEFTKYKQLFPLPQPEIYSHDK